MVTIYLRQSQGIQVLNTNAIASVKGVYDRGVALGVFRPGLDPVDIHSAIPAYLNFFCLPTTTADVLRRVARLCCWPPECIHASSCGLA